MFEDLVKDIRSSLCFRRFKQLRHNAFFYFVTIKSCITADDNVAKTFKTAGSIFDNISWFILCFIANLASHLPFFTRYKHVLRTFIIYLQQSVQTIVT